MLCFLPPLPAAPRGDLPPAPAPKPAGITGTVIVTLVALCAVLAPLGWTARPRPRAMGSLPSAQAGSQPVFTVRVGDAARIGPPMAGRQDAALRPVDATATEARSRGKEGSFSAVAVPPGLALDAATGVLAGTPTLAGTYAVEMTAGADRSHAFTVLVLPR